MKGTILLAILVVLGTASAQTIKNPIKRDFLADSVAQEDGVWYITSDSLMYLVYNTEESARAYLDEFFKEMAIDRKRPYKVYHNDYHYKTLDHREIILDWMPNGSGGNRLFLTIRKY